MSSFREFFDQELKKELDELEAQRAKSYKKKPWWILLIPFVLIIVSFNVLTGRVPEQIMALIVGCIFVFGFGGCVAYLRYFSQRYRRDTDPVDLSPIIDKIAKFVDPGLSYDPDGLIPPEESHILEFCYPFPTVYDDFTDEYILNRYWGDSLVSGKMNDVDVKLCELYWSRHDIKLRVLPPKPIKTLADCYDTRVDRAKSETLPQLFMQAQLSETISEPVVIEYSYGNTFLGNIADAVGKVRFQKPLVDLNGIPEFSKKCKVYSRNADLAKRVLTEQKQKACALFYNEDLRGSTIQFNGDKVSAFIQDINWDVFTYRRGLFGVKMSRPLNDFSLYDKMHHYINDFLSLGVLLAK